MVVLAKEIMDSNLLALDSETDVLTAARRMVEARKGYAVVTRGGPTKIAGIVTEWDFLEKVVAPGADPARLTLGQIASTDIQGCAPDTPTDEVATRMATLGIRRMIVRSGDHVMGVITSRHLIGIFRQYIDRLSSQIAGYQSSTTPLG
jgi:CBS domain-containing protein